MAAKKCWMEEVEELKDFDGDLVEELIRRYRPLVYHMARRVCPRLSRDEDLLQCGLIGLWQAAESWDGERPFRPLAVVCIENAMRSHLRSLRRQVSTLPLEAAEELPWEQDWSESELRLEAERLLEPGSRARALTLAVVDGWKLSDAAGEVCLRPARARNRLRRAGRKLGVG